MKYKLEQYADCIAATEQAVEGMYADYAEIGRASDYIIALRRNLKTSGAYCGAALAIIDRGHLFNATRGNYGATYPSEMPLLYEHRGIPDGITIGLEACRRALGNDFETVMPAHIERTLYSDDRHPMRYADMIIARSTNVYDFALDAPVQSTVDLDPDTLPSSHLRDLAEIVRADMAGDYVYDKYFKVGVGIARHAYNSYVIEQSRSFDDLLRNAGFAEDDFGNNYIKSRRQHLHQTPFVCYTSPVHY